MFTQQRAVVTFEQSLACLSPGQSQSSGQQRIQQPKSENLLVFCHQANMEDETLGTTLGTKLNWLYTLWDQSLPSIKKYRIFCIGRN